MGVCVPFNGLGHSIKTRAQCIQYVAMGLTQTQVSRGDSQLLKFKPIHNSPTETST